MANYTSPEEMAVRLSNLPPTSETWSVLVSAVDAAEAAIDGHCGRPFTKDATATARVFKSSCSYVDVSDIATTVGLIVADTDTTYTSTQYQLEPLNGIGPDGKTGWPYDLIRLIDGSAFVAPSYAGQATVTITATWGWPSVPTAVKEAARILAADLYRMKDNQFGVAGFGEMGVLMVRENKTVANLLRPYRRASVFGFA